MGDFFLVIGGLIDGVISGRVTRYSKTGQYEDRGYLNVERAQLACAKYTDHQGTDVSFSMFGFITKVLNKNINIDFLHPLRWF